MEKMPYQPDLDNATATIASDWKNALPVLVGTKVTLRELEVSDAPSLFAMLTTEEVSRFISPPPTTIEGFERFIMWAKAERAAGRYACFAVVPHGMQTAIGLFQVRQLEPGFATAEWGFALGSAFWGSGMFADGAEMVVNFAVETVGVRRLEARAAVANGRKACCVAHSLKTASFWTKCCGPSFVKSGARPSRLRGRAWSTSSKIAARHPARQASPAPLCRAEV
jgi:RimJ/RimL family protein N-acetyltransferase